MCVGSGEEKLFHRRKSLRAYQVPSIMPGAGAQGLQASEGLEVLAGGSAGARLLIEGLLHF